jgi:hypothetical protein
MKAVNLLFSCSLKHLKKIKFVFQEVFYKNDMAISSIAKENFVKNEGSILQISCPEKNIVDEVAIQLKQWLQEDYNVITNKSGDKVFLSKDGLRKVRYDFINSHGTQPHMLIEIKVNDEWIDAADIHRIYPKD